LFDRDIVIILNKKEKIIKDMNKKLVGEKAYIVTSNFVNKPKSRMNEAVFKYKDLAQEYVCEQENDIIEYHIEKIPLVAKRKLASNNG